MPTTLLFTKLTPPPLNPQLVHRARLADQIDTTLRAGHKLLLISAPAGFGKTTVLVEWLRRHHQLPVAWLSLDDEDNRLDQFLEYLIAALQTVRPEAGEPARTLLPVIEPQSPARIILTLVLNALAESSQPIVLILDDYHVIDLQAIHDAVAFLLEHMPPNLHMIITSRADPPLPLARLRVRGQFTELRAADLRFTPDEAARFFERIRGLRLSPGAVETLEARTEGWIAGLQLAALSLREQDSAQIDTFIADFAGSHRYVLDYLADEVFQRQPAHIQRFMMRTAILTHLCGPLCDAITGLNDGQATLEQLEHANLFLVRLDNSRRWYRYHHLFADFLRERLEREPAQNERALLHRRASAWYAQNDQPGEAIDHALLGQDWEAAVGLLGALIESPGVLDHSWAWGRWLAALPDAVLGADPDFCLKYAMTLLRTAQQDGYDRPLRLAEHVWRAADNWPKIGEIMSIRAFVARFKGDLAGAVVFAQHALANLPAGAGEQRALANLALGQSQLFLGDVGAAEEALAAAYVGLQGASETYEALVVAWGLGFALLLRGRLRQAAAQCQDVIRRAQDVPQWQVPAAYIHLGAVYYEWNDLEAAEQALRQGIEAAQKTGRWMYWPVGCGLLACVLWARGQAAQANQVVEQALEAARMLDNPQVIAEVRAYQTRLWLAQGDPRAAAQWRTAHVFGIDDRIAYERQTEYLTLVRVCLAQPAPGAKELHSVITLLHHLLTIAEATGRMRDVIKILVLKALAQAAAREPGQAHQALARALALAEPEAYLRTFIDAGTALADLLAHAAVQQAAPAYARKLLLIFSKPPDALSTPGAAPGGWSPLSDRERDILRLIAEGRSVAEVAETLIISVHTTRTHIKHIYGKLDVHSRIQALERARTLQLL